MRASVKASNRAALAYNVGNSSAVPPFKPEVLSAYETGFKSTFADNTVQVNGAAFYYHYEDEQVQSAFASPAGPIGDIANAPKSHLTAAKSKLFGSPSMCSSSSNRSAGKKGNSTNTSSSVRAPDRPSMTRAIAKASRRSATMVRSTYLPARGLLAGSGNGLRIPRPSGPLLLQQLAGGPLFNVKAYWLANANLTLTPENAPWSVALFGHNIFDQKYDTTRNFFLTGIDIAQRGEPATVGVRVSLKY